MSVAGISSSNFLNNQNTSVQNQQQQQQWLQEFQKLGQELQSGALSPQTTAQTTAQTELTALQPGPPTSAISQTTTSQTSISKTQSSDPAAGGILHAPVGTPRHGIHVRDPHRLRVDAGDGNDSSPQDSNPLGQLPGNSSAAQQAYGSWQQDLQQVALNSDLLTAQGADWQPVSLSA